MLSRPPTTRLVYAFSVLFAAVFVHYHAGHAPVIDDYFYLNLWLNPSPPSLASLWEPLNEHRLPLPKFVTWLTARCFGVNLQMMMALDLAALALATSYPPLCRCCRFY